MNQAINNKYQVGDFKYELRDMTRKERRELAKLIEKFDFTSSIITLDFDNDFSDEELEQFYKLVLEPINPSDPEVDVGELKETTEAEIARDFLLKMVMGTSNFADSLPDSIKNLMSTQKDIKN